MTAIQTTTRTVTNEDDKKERLIQLYVTPYEALTLRTGLVKLLNPDDAHTEGDETRANRMIPVLDHIIN